MKRKTVIAVVTVCMMLLTLSPAAAFGASAKTGGHGPSSWEDDLFDENPSQICLGELDETYEDCVEAKEKYCSVIWTEIQAVYQEGRRVYAAIETEEDYWNLEKDYEAILEKLSGMTWVRGMQDLKTVKEKYLKEIAGEYRNYKAADYNDFYWDWIQDSLYMGKKQLNSAVTFADAAAGYLTAMEGMEWACDKETIAEFRNEAIMEIRQYVNLALDPARFSAAEWKQITAIRDQAIRDLKATELESDMEYIYEEAGKQFYEITGVKFPIEGETIIDQLSDALDEYLYKLDWDLYSEARLEQLDDICWEAEEAFYEAETRAQAQKIYDDALAKMKAVPTKAEEIAAIQKIQPTITSVKSKNSYSVKVSWKKAANASGYILYRAASAKGKYSKVAAVKGTSTVDTGLKLGKKYYYKIRAYKTLDKKEYLSKYSAAVKGVPMLAKTSVSLSKSGSNAVLVKWKKIKDAKGYEIYRATSYNGAYSKVKTVKGEANVSWKDAKVKKGKVYYYKIRSYCSVKGKKKCSPYSAVKKIKR